MTRRHWSNLLRGFGYLIAFGCILYYFANASEESQAEDVTYVAIAFCCGMLFTVVGVVLRYIPESERSIRQRVEQEQEARKQGRRRPQG